MFFSLLSYIRDRLCSASDLVCKRTQRHSLVNSVEHLSETNWPVFVPIWVVEGWTGGADILQAQCTVLQYKAFSASVRGGGSVVSGSYFTGHLELLY